MRPSALCLLLGMPGCFAGALETSRDPFIVDGTASSLPVAVAVYRYRTVRLWDERVNVASFVGSGVLLCPSVVLTVRHNVLGGSVAVSNEGDIRRGTRDVLYRNQKGEETVRNSTIVAEPMARQEGFPVPLPTLTESNRGDGLVAFKVSPPFSPFLSYPDVAPGLPAVGDDVVIHGYGRDVLEQTEELRSGFRRTATLRFEGSRPVDDAGFHVLPDRSVLEFSTGGPKPAKGDSGGPVFVPARRWWQSPTLMGLFFWQVPGRRYRGFSFDAVSATDWIATVRRALCPPDVPMPVWTTELAPADEPLDTSGMEAVEAGEGTEEGVPVCICEPDCETGCAGSSDWPDES